MDSSNVTERIRIRILREKQKLIDLQLEEFEKFLRKLPKSPDSAMIIALNCRLQRLMNVFSTFNDVYAELKALVPVPGYSNSSAFQYPYSHIPDQDYQSPWYVEDKMEKRYIEAVTTAKKLLSAADCHHLTQMADSANGNETATLLRECVSSVVSVLQKFEKKLNETEVALKSA